MQPNTSKTAGRYHHGNLRAALLCVARELLEEGGPGALNLREIARRVGVSAPSAYHHFESLDAIAVALAEKGFAELAEQFEAAPTNEKGRLAPAGSAYIAFARANPGLYRLMFGEGFRAASQKNDMVRSLRERLYQRLKRGLEQRLPAEQAPTAALFLWSLVHGLTLLIIDGQVEPGSDPDAMIESVLRLAGAGLPTSR